MIIYVNGTMTKNSDQYERSMTQNRDQYERSKTTTTNRDQYESMLNDLWRLCLHLHKDALAGTFLMDDPHLINAINKNEADLVSNITNSFFGSALAQMLKDCSGVKQYFQRSDMRYVIGSCSQFVTTINKDRREFLKDKNVPLSIGLYEKTTTTLLLMMLSCISSNCYKCISYSLLQLRISDYGSDSYVWSWLFCLTTCVLSTAAHVYEMYATDLEMKHPLCQVLLLDHSIQHFCLYFLTIGPSRNHILKFTKYVQESGQMGLLGGILTRDDLTLKFFFENNTLSGVISKHFSPHQVIGLENGKGSAQLPSSDGCAAGKACRAHHGAKIADSSHQCLECGQKIHSALLCGMSISQIVTKYPHLSGHKLRSSRNDRRIVEDNNDEDMNGVCFTCIEKMTVGTNSGGGMSADKDDGIHKSVHTETVAPSATVASLSSSVYDNAKGSKKDEFDDKGSSFGRSESTLSKKAVAYVVPSVTEEKYQQLRCQLLKIMRQLQPYGIFRVLEESPSKNKDKQSSYNKKCVEFCNKKFGDVGSAYKIYLTKMVAYSGLLIHDILGVEHNNHLLVHQNLFAHILSYCLDGSYDEKRKINWKIFFGKLVPRSAFSTNGNNPHCNLLLYFKKCFDSMKIEPPEGNQLDYYYDHDYFPDATKIVVERKQHHAQIGQDGSGTKKRKEKSPVGKKKPGVNGIGNTVLVATGAGGRDGHGIQSSGMKKKTKTISVSKKDNHAKMDAKKGYQYLSPDGKNTCVNNNRTSKRTSPATKFFTPS